MEVDKAAPTFMRLYLVSLHTLHLHVHVSLFMQRRINADTVWTLI